MERELLYYTMCAYCYCLGGVAANNFWYDFRGLLLDTGTFIPRNRFCVYSKTESASEVFFATELKFNPCVLFLFPSYVLAISMSNLL